VVAKGLKSGEALDCHKCIAACGEHVGSKSSKSNLSTGSICLENVKSSSNAYFWISITRSFRSNHEFAPRMNLPYVSQMKTHLRINTTLLHQPIPLSAVNMSYQQILTMSLIKMVTGEMDQLR